MKAFAEQKVSSARSEIVFGILVVEDLIAILLLAVLTAAASGARLDGAALLRTVGRLAGFLAALLAGGMLIVPRLVRAVIRLRRSETTVVAAVGLCFAFALLARKMGYSVALGAFLCGALVAESGAGKLVEQRIEPVRDLFAAVFFVSVGMLIDPRLIWAHAGTVLALTAVVVVGKLVGVSVGAFVAGYGIPTAVQTALSLGQIGEFSFIIAGVGLSLGVTRSFLYPVAVAVSALTTLLTPFLIRASGRVGALVDRKLPHTLQTYATLYGAWVQGLRSTAERRTAWSRIRRRAKLVVLDAALCAVIVIAGSLSARGLAQWAARVAGVGPAVARVALIGATLALLFPFVLGAVRMARALAVELAAEALPAPSGKETLDLAAAPRRALLVTLQIAILLVAGVPLMAVTQPFLPRFEGMAILLLSLALLLVALLRSASELQGHVRAGAQVFLEALAAQSGLDAAGTPQAGRWPRRSRRAAGPGQRPCVSAGRRLTRHRPHAAPARPARADGRDGDRHRSRAGGRHLSHRRRDPPPGRHPGGHRRRRGGGSGPGAAALTMTAGPAARDVDPNRASSADGDFAGGGAILRAHGNRAPERARVEASEPTRGSPGASLTSTAKSVG